MLLKRSNSIYSWSSTISLPSRVFKFTDWVNSLKRTHSLSNSYLLISIFAFPKALLLNSHQIRQRILIGSWLYNYYDFMRKLLLPTSPSLVHSEIMHRNYVVSSITALLQISTKICLPTYLTLLRKALWSFIITEPQRPALQIFTLVWATNFIFLQIPHLSNRYAFLVQLDFFEHPWFCSSLLSGPELEFYQLMRTMKIRTNVQI